LIVVSNSTILIGLARINKLDLLKKLFSRVYISDAVFKELIQVVFAGFEVMGLMGVLLMAKRYGFLKSIKPLIEELKKKKFRVAEDIVAEILKSAGE
jgi:predicted nucleic acid-binding protein